MILQDGIPIDINRSGDYVYNASMTAGSVALEISMDGEPYAQIDDASFSSSAVVLIHLPQCKIRATYTGDAVAQLKLQDKAR